MDGKQKISYRMRSRIRREPQNCGKPIPLAVMPIMDLLRMISSQTLDQVQK